MNPPDWSGFDLHDIDTTGISDADLALDREPIDEDAHADFLELCATVEARIGRAAANPRRPARRESATPLAIFRSK
jgi:hypothetical protein